VQNGIYQIARGSDIADNFVLTRRREKMKKTAILAAITLVAFTSMMSFAYAADIEKSLMAANEPSEYIGAPVKNLQGDKLGSIRDLVTDPSGEISFAILSHGGIMGMGAKETAVPFKALTYRDDTKEFTFDVTKERLASAPEYKRGTDLNDHDAALEIYQFYGITPPWEESMKKEEGTMEGGKDY
jgi:hypothetical protein